tara:strand:- start:50 stop:976 length:927 start_codon:yes stop_codon:yes gene_type:complete
MKTVSHDNVNRFLDRERFEPKDLYDEEKDKIELSGGVLSVDDSVLDKPYSDPSKAAFIDWFWSGKHKRTVKGINLITLFYTDIRGVSVPVNFRLVNKKSGQTKNDYFKEMLIEVLSWGLNPAWVTGDSWYSSLDNLKFIRKQNLNFMFGIENNRVVSEVRGQYIQIQKFEGWSSDDSATLYLKDYGMVKVFRQIYKKAYRYYIMSTAELDNLESITQVDFNRVHDAHWCIERFHRAIKQVCNIERFQVRNSNPIKNHVFCAIKAFVKLEFMRLNEEILHWYEVKRDLYVKVIRDYISGSTKNDIAVNA